MVKNLGMAIFAFSMSIIAANAESGRCLLEVGGKKYIDGTCNITKEDSGRDICIGCGDKRKASKYFAMVQVGVDQLMNDANDDTAVGFWNGHGGGGHAHDSLGTLKREGSACWVNSTAKVCAWR